MIELDENDSNLIIIIKLTILAATVLVMGISVMSQGIKILSQRKKKVGFVK